VSGKASMSNARSEITPANAIKTIVVTTRPRWLRDQVMILVSIVGDLFGDRGQAALQECPLVR